MGALALPVPDYDAAIFFFVTVMGFRLTADTDPGHKRRVTVEPPGGGAAQVLARAEGPQQVAATRKQAGGRVFLFPETDDFARDPARMTAAGIVLKEKPRHEFCGTVAVWRDPFRNRWDLTGRR